MGKKVYRFIDLSNKRNVYAVGDIHGCFSKLESLLEEIGFDVELDALLSVGDLVDRGPQSDLAVYYAAKPWFHHIIGNHEEMTQAHLLGDSYMHTINGGGWMAKLSPEEKEAHVAGLLDSSYMLEVSTPGGLNVGLVHADLAHKSWQENITNPSFNTLTWSREGVRKLRNPEYDPTISGIDKVFFGHNALLKSYKRGNCYWIDTGSGFDDGHLTIINVDTDRVYKGK